MRMIKILVILLVCIIPSLGHPHKYYHDCGICYVQIDDIDFGEYNPIDNHIVRSEALLRIRCSVPRTCTIYYTVKLIGGNSNNGFTRYMFSPSTKNKIYYYLVADHKCRWGDGTNGTCSIYGSVTGRCSGDEKEIIHVITGIIPPMQNVPVANDYQDHLTVIIEY